MIIISVYIFARNEMKWECHCELWLWRLHADIMRLILNMSHFTFTLLNNNVIGH